MTALALLDALPIRFWVYVFLLTVIAGLMTGTARLPWWSGAIAGVVAGGATVVVVLMLLRMEVSR